MSEFYLGQIMMGGFSFAPKYFAQCNGQLLPINQNQALFALLGTQFGGNGITTFALPDLRSRTPIGYASSVDPNWQPPSVQIGQAAGAENVTLLSSNLPAHTHTVNATTATGNSRNPRNNLFATESTPALYAAPATTVPLNPATIGRCYKELNLEHPVCWRNSNVWFWSDAEWLASLQWQRASHLGV